MKDSGLGRSHSKFGLYECVNVKLAEPGSRRGRATSGGTRTTSRSAEALHASAQLLYGRDADKPAALRRGARPAAAARCASRCATRLGASPRG